MDPVIAFRSLIPHSPILPFSHILSHFVPTRESYKTLLPFTVHRASANYFINAWRSPVNLYVHYPLLSKIPCLSLAVQSQLDKLYPARHKKSVNLSNKTSNSINKQVVALHRVLGVLTWIEFLFSLGGQTRSSSFSTLVSLCASRINYSIKSETRSSKFDLLSLPSKICWDVYVAPKNFPGFFQFFRNFWNFFRAVFAKKFYLLQDQTSRSRIESLSSIWWIKKRGLTSSNSFSRDQLSSSMLDYFLCMDRQCRPSTGSWTSSMPDSLTGDLLNHFEFLEAEIVRSLPSNSLEGIIYDLSRSFTGPCLRGFIYLYKQALLHRTCLAQRWTGTSQLGSNVVFYSSELRDIRKANFLLDSINLFPLGSNNWRPSVARLI